MRDQITQPIFRIVVGEPPARDAPTAMRLRWVRRFYTRFVAVYLMLFIIAAVSTLPLWMWIVFAVATVIWLEGLISISLRIRREERS